MSEERSTEMTADGIEQMKARLKREDEAKEEAFEKRLEEIREGQAPWRAEQEAKERAEEQKRRKLLDDARHKREQEMKKSALASWESSGGTEAEFEKAWPSLRLETLKRRTLEDGERARIVQRRSNISTL